MSSYGNRDRASSQASSMKADASSGSIGLRDVRDRCGVERLVAERAGGRQWRMLLGEYRVGAW